MRKLRWIYAFVGGFFLVTGGLGIAVAAPSPQVITAHRFDMSKPLRDMRWQLSPLMQHLLGRSRATPAQIERLRTKLVKAGVLPAPGTIRGIPLYRKQPARSTLLPVHDAAVQRAIPQTGTWAPNVFTSPSIGFDGLGNSTGYNPGVYPPDPNAAVGMNYVVEMVNLAFAVFNKSDGTMVLGPVDTNTLWSGFGGACESDNQGDGIVMYDQLAHRWVISQFALSGPYYQCIAVSTTNNPTGSWYRYAFEISKTDINDYPKLGVWPNAYYYTANLFNAGRGGFDGVALVAFDRAQLIVGDPAAQMVLFDVPYGSGQRAYSVLPATLDGYNLPPAGAPGIFLNYVSPNLWGTSNYALQMWQMQVDWQTPANSTLTGPTQITVPAFNDLVCGGKRNCIPQPNGWPGLDAISDRLMYRLAYRNLGSKQALVVDQTVGVNNTSPPTAMRWYQLTAPANSNTWSLAQSGTFAPGVTTAGGASRWMGSIAMDHHGDIALGYSLSSTSIAPAIAYTGQVVGSPLGKMSEPETILKAGGGEQTGYGFRWGDYTSMASDPVDSCTFWYTNEYYASTSLAGWSTHIGAFAFPGCPPIILGTLSGTVSVAATGQPGKDVLVMVEPGDIVTRTGADGKYAFRLLAGGYTVEALKYPDLAKSGSIAVSLDQTTTQDLSLQAAPLVTLSGKVIDAGLGNGAVVAHGWPLYAGITVTTPYVGKVAEGFTDPVTGVYHMQLAQNFPFTLQVVAHGDYTPATAALAPLTKDATKDFALVLDKACTAAGYAVPFSENFNAGVPPSGWTVTSAVSGSITVWNTNVYWEDWTNPSNWTGGTGLAATVDSFQAAAKGGLGYYDTSLIMPKIPVSGLGVNPEVNFLMQLWQVDKTGGLDVDINVDGTGWTTMAHFNTSLGVYDGLPGVSEYIDLKPYIPSGAQEIQIRWRYYDYHSPQGWNGDVQVDDATIGSCQATSGGLIVGRVTNIDTGDPVAATVSDDLNEATATFTNPADLNLKNRNLYILFASSGQRTLTAAGSNGLSDLAVLPVGDSTVTPYNFRLGNADLLISQITGGTVTQGTQGNVGEVVVTNNGPDTAAGVQLAVNSTAGASAIIQVKSATTTAGTCTVNSQTNGVDCSLGDIPSGQSVTVAVSAFGQYVGQAGLSAVAGEADSDPDASNNTAVAQVKVIAAVVKVPAQGSGGGSLGLWSLILLFGLAGIMITMRIRRRRGL